MTIEVRPLSAALGTEIIGADPARPGDDAQYEQIHDPAHTRHMHGTTIKGDRPV
jgi:alpha-ketoglutarate-dependent taurine dioxygenase